MTSARRFEFASESVKPLPNVLRVVTTLGATRLIFSSGHWRCSISGRALKDRLVLKLGGHFSFGFAPVKKLDRAFKSLI
jgi:hypothetical protein